MLKIGRDLLDHGTLKLGVKLVASHKWADWLNDFCMLIVIE